MIDTIEEFNYLVKRLKNKNKEGKLGKSLQIKLQAFLEVEQLINKQAEAKQLVKHDVSGSVCLDTELQIKLGELMQQVESSHCYLEKNKLRNKMSAICILLDIDTF